MYQHTAPHPFPIPYISIPVACYSCATRYPCRYSLYPASSDQGWVGKNGFLL